MDKLRKFGELLWLIKERLILVAMVAILCFQVYKVLYPDEQAAAKPPVPPKDAPGDVDPPPPNPPEYLLANGPGDYRLDKSNPFWYFSSRIQRRGGSDTGGGADIHLLDIQNTNGQLQAQLKTSTTTKWYPEGTAFEQFRLVSVDEAAQTATVYVESSGREVTLSKE